MDGPARVWYASTTTSVGACVARHRASSVIRPRTLGYDLHITRRAEWSDDDGPSITLDEWLAYIRSDPAVTPDPDNGPQDFLVSVGAEPCPLWWDRGELLTKHPDKAFIRKMVSIARALNARVVGDDGEEYT